MRVFLIIVWDSTHLIDFQEDIEVGGEWGGRLMLMGGGTDLKILYATGKRVFGFLS
jgi:hypothetical protein